MQARRGTVAAPRGPLLRTELQDDDDDHGRDREDRKREREEHLNVLGARLLGQRARCIHVDVDPSFGRSRIPRPTDGRHARTQAVLVRGSFEA